MVSHPVHSGWRKLAFVLLWELKLEILAVVGVAPWALALEKAWRHLMDLAVLMSRGWVY